MNDIIGGLKDKNEFPEWYEGLHKALFRANEFLGKQNRYVYLEKSKFSFLLFKDERAVMKDEFANMLISWDIDEASAEKAFDFITDHGQKKMDCKLIFSLEYDDVIIRSCPSF